MSIFNKPGGGNSIFSNSNSNQNQSSSIFSKPQQGTGLFSGQQNTQQGNQIYIQEAPYSIRDSNKEALDSLATREVATTCSAVEGIIKEGLVCLAAIRALQPTCSLRILRISTQQEAIINKGR